MAVAGAKFDAWRVLVGGNPKRHSDFGLGVVALRLAVVTASIFAQPKPIFFGAAVWVLAVPFDFALDGDALEVAPRRQFFDGDDGVVAVFCCASTLTVGAPRPSISCLL